MKYLKNLITAALGTIFSIVGCSEDTKTSANVLNDSSAPTFTDFNSISTSKKLSVNPLYKDLDVPFKTFKVDASKDTVLMFGAKKTQIKIAAKSFIHEDGIPVKGEVTIKYREIRTPAEIILSGITMKYDSAGTTYDFQTAGMFDIQGYKNNDPIEISPSKPLTIEYKSNQSEPDYNFYCLDEQNANWSYLSTPKVSSEKLKVRKIAEPNSSHGSEVYLDSKPKFEFSKPQEALKDQEIWDLEYDYKEYPMFASLAGVMWQYVGDSVNNPLNAEEGLIWKPTAIIPIDEKKGVFKVTIKSGDQRLVMKMKPIYKGKHFEYANNQFKKKLNAYKRDLLNHMKKNKEQKERNIAYKKSVSSTTAAVNQTFPQATRSLKVPSFGVYNCDRYSREKNVIKLLAKINEPFPDAQLTEAKVFLVSKNGTVVVNKSHLNTASNFKFVSSESNKLIALYPDKRVSVLGNAYFKKIKLNENQKQNTQNFRNRTIIQ
jgi:hypothetical protein